MIILFNFFRGRWLRTRSLVDWARTLFGIRVTAISVPLYNAGRALSYHLEVVGPEQTYLARQSTFEGEAEKDVPGFVVASRRRGQRHAHLYVRASGHTDLLAFNALFYERMPGSMAPAAVSAISVAVLTWLAYASIGRTGLFDNWEYAALVLAFPAAISIWVGVDSERRLLQGVLSARISTLLTVAVGVIAAALSVAHKFAGTPNEWLFLALLATLNAGAAAVSWTVRAKVLSDLVNKKRADGS